MATTYKLNHYQLRESLLNWNQTHSLNPIPDFRTREKTAFVWSKTYITLTNGDVTFTQLNFFQRIFRYLCGWYADTIVDSGTRAKVTAYIHDLLSTPAFQEVLKFHQQIRAASLKGDFTALEMAMTQFGKTVEKPVQDDLDEMIQRVRSHPTTEIVERFKDDYISETFLNEVLSLAAVHGKTPQSEQMWKGIEIGLRQNSDEQRGQLNIALFRELIRIIEGNGTQVKVPKTESDLITIPCQRIEVTDMIQRKIKEGMKPLRLIQQPASWVDYLHNYQLLVQFNIELTELREEVKTMLLDERAGLTKALGDKFRELGAHEVLISQYLADEERLAERLFFHAEITKEGSEFARVSSEILGDISALQKAMALKINAEYETLPNRGGGNCFFLSCDQHLPVIDSTWREKIAAHLLQSRAKYERIVLQRIGTDSMTPPNADFKSYCEWIQKDGSWGSQPELEAFSEIVQRTVVVVQNQHAGPFEWGGIFNPNYGGDPIIFKNHGACHYEAMILKTV